MKHNNISKIASILLLSVTMMSNINANENLSGSLVMIQSGNHYNYLGFDDTSFGGSSVEWWIRGAHDHANSEFAIMDDISSSAKEVIGIEHSGNNEYSLMIDSSGDINLAKGSVFIDRSTKHMGIGTVTPTTALEINNGDANPEITLTNGSKKFTIDHNRPFIGSTNNYFNIGGANRYAFVMEHNAPNSSLYIANGGNIGIGTATPQEKLDVLAKEDGARLVLTTIGDDTYDAPQFTSRRAGSNGSGVADNTKNLDVMGTFAWRGHDGTDWTGAKALFWVRADGDWSTTSTGTTVEIRQTPKNSTTALIAMQIKNHADVYFPNGNLYVKGTKVNVPDYVFKEDYKLMPLNELKTFISKNNHLPGVTSAEEVDKAGVVNLSGLQMTLLEKVEELTLYTLQQEEALKTKASKIAAMEAKIEKLETMQKRLVRVESLLTNLALDTSNMKSEKVSVNLK